MTVRTLGVDRGRGAFAAPPESGSLFQAVLAVARYTGAFHVKGAPQILRVDG
jgi:hypothetical protein